MQKLVNVFKRNYPYLLILILSALAAYNAINYTYSLLAQHSLGPFGDDFHELRNTIYPLLQGKGHWYYIFTPYADHRIIWIHLIGLFNVFFTHGTEVIQPTLSFLTITARVALFALVAYKYSPLKKTNHYLLTCLLVMITFYGGNYVNSMSTIHFTWPLVILFSMMSFACLIKFNQTKKCQPLPSSKDKWFIAMLASYGLATASFSPGLIVCPILILLMFKERTPFKYIITTSLFGTLITMAYFYHWHSTDVLGLNAFLHHPLNMLTYLSNMLTFSIDIQSQAHTGWYSLIGLGGIILFVYFCYDYIFKNKKNQCFDTFLMGCLIFFFGALFLAAFMRFWIPAESTIGGRFLEPSLLFWFFLLTKSACHWGSKKNFLTKSSLISLSSILLFTFSLSHFSNNVSSLNIRNLQNIIFAEGIPYSPQIGKLFGVEIADLPTKKMNSIIRVQKIYQLSAFSLWQRSILQTTMGQLIQPTTFQCLGNNIPIKNGKSLIHIKHHQFIEINTVLPKKYTSSQWSNTVIYTNIKKQIIGFGLLGEYTNGALRLIFDPDIKRTWLGILPLKNTDNRPVSVWLVSRDRENACFAGNINYHKESSHV